MSKILEGGKAKILVDGVVVAFADRVKYTKNVDIESLEIPIEGAVDCSGPISFTARLTHVSPELEELFGIRLNMYDAFEAMHKADGTTNGRRKCDFSL